MLGAYTSLIFVLLFAKTIDFTNFNVKPDGISPVVEGKEMRKRFFKNNHNLKNLIYSLKHEEKKAYCQCCGYACGLCGQRGRLKVCPHALIWGETPWKFTKVVRQEINLAKDAQVCFDGKAVSVVHDGDVHSEWKPVNAQEGGFWTVDWVKPSACLP